MSKVFGQAETRRGYSVELMNKTLDRRIIAFVEYQLENYHRSTEIEEQRRHLIALTKATPNPVDAAALAIVNDTFLSYTDISRRTIAYVLNCLDPIDTQLINLLYFKRSHTVTGAGMEVGLSKTQAYRHRNAIIYRLAVELGYTPRKNEKRWEKSGNKM